MDKCFYTIHHAPVNKRSGEIAGSMTDYELSEFGVEMAKYRAQKIKRAMAEKAISNIDKIITSPLKRAVCTAEIIAETCDIRDISQDDRASAQSFGDLEGMTIEEIMGHHILKYNMWDYIDEQNRESHKAPNAESNDDIKLRTKELAQDALSRDENILLVTHGTVIDALISARDNQPMYKIEGKNRQFEGRLLTISSDSYDVIGEDGEQFDYIPQVDNALREGRDLAYILNLARKYLDDNSVETFERIYLQKLISLAERKYG